MSTSRVRGRVGPGGRGRGERSGSGGRGSRGRDSKTVELALSSKTNNNSDSVTVPPQIAEQGQGHIVEDEDDPVLQALLLTRDYQLEVKKGDSSLHILVENLELLDHVRIDPESGEEISWLFGMLTIKGSILGDNVKVAKIIRSIEAAGAHTHTYDAKSGSSAYRVTRIGVTTERLLSYAESINFVRGLDRDRTREACHQAGLRIENPAGASSTNYFDPFEALSAPFVAKAADLYEPLTSGEKMKLCSLLITGDSHFKGSAKGCGLDIKKLEYTDKENVFCLAIFPLHDFPERDKLREKWMPWAMPWELPIRDIRNYFSEEVGFYFAFLQHLTSRFFPLSFFSVAAQVWSAVELSSGTRVMYSSGVVSIVYICSFSVILDSWKWKQGKLSHLWHCVEDEESQEPPRRPGFRGIILRNLVTGQLEIDFPDNLRLPRARISLVASAVMIIVLLSTVAIIFAYKAVLTRDPTTNRAILLIPPLLNAAQITVFGVVYQKVAEVLTDFENHKTVQDHNSALFKKLTFFYMVSNYSSSFYIAFMKGSIEGCYDAITQSEFCGLELSIQVAVAFIVNDFLSRISYSVVLPRLQRFWKERSLQKDSSLDYDTIGYVEKQFRTLGKYDPTSSLILDYIELYVQWGYLCLFGAAFPLALFLSFGTNFIETRTDGIKLLMDYRRVLPNRVSGIGEPLSAFYFVLYLAVPINAGLCVYTFEVAKFIPQAYRVWVFTLLTVVLGLLLVQLDALYSKMPLKTAIQIKRQRVVYKRVILGETGDGDDEEALEVDLDESMIGLTLAKVQHKSISRKTSFMLPSKRQTRMYEKKNSKQNNGNEKPITTTVKVLNGGESFEQSTGTQI